MVMQVFELVKKVINYLKMISKYILKPQFKIHKWNNIELGPMPSLIILKLIISIVLLF